MPSYYSKKNIVRVKSVLPLPSCSQDGRLYVKCFHSKEILVGHDWYQELESEVFSVFLSTCLFNGSWASSGGQNHEQCRHDHTIYFTMRYCLRYAVWNVLKKIVFQCWVFQDKTLREPFNRWKTSQYFTRNYLIVAPLYVWGILLPYYRKHTEKGEHLTTIVYIFIMCTKLLFCFYCVWERQLSSTLIGSVTVCFYINVLSFPPLMTMFHRRRNTIYVQCCWSCMERLLQCIDSRDITHSKIKRLSDDKIVNLMSLSQAHLFL